MSDTPTKPEEAQAETIPTWGYSATDPAQIFHLAKGESLPEGWHDSPASIPVVEATGGGNGGGGSSAAGGTVIEGPGFEGKSEGICSF
jgi:hypothetical protein